MGGLGKIRDEPTCRRVMSAAVKLFEQQGYANVTIQDIVESIGMSKGAFYYHFDSKEELLYQIHEEFITYELVHARAIVARGGTAKAQLKAIMQTLMESIDIYKSNVAIFFQERRHLSAESFEKIRLSRREYDQIVSSVVQRGQEEGEFRSDLPHRIMTFALFGMHDWAYQWFDRNRGLTAQEIADIFAAIFLDGVATTRDWTAPDSSEKRGAPV